MKRNTCMNGNSYFLSTRLKFYFIITEIVQFCFDTHVYRKNSFLFSSVFSVKIRHRLSYSVLSNISSCKGFLYNLSKDLIVC